MGHLLGAIDQKKLDEQRGVVQNEKRQGDNAPYGKAFGTIVTNLFPPGHPYSWEVIGSMEDLNAASLDDVKKWFQTYYGPNNATLVLAGDIDLATAKEKVQRYFGDIPPGPPLTRRERSIPVSVPPTRIVMQDRVPEARIYKVWLGPEWISDDSTYLQLADYVLTSGKTSRLYQRLVYKDQIATDAGAFALNNEIAGAYIVYATAGPGQDLAKVEKALDEELARFLRAGAHARRARSRARPRSAPRSRAASSRSAAAAANRAFSRRTPCTAVGRISTSIRSSCCAPPRRNRSSRPRARWIKGAPLVLEVQPFSRDAEGRGRRRRSNEAADADVVPRRAVPGDEPGDARERHAPDRGRAPRGARRAVQPAAERRIRGRSVRRARRREHDDGDARRRHHEHGRAEDRRRARAPRRGLEQRRESRLLGREPVRAEGESRRLARDLRRRDPESCVPRRPSSTG